MALFEALTTLASVIVLPPFLLVLVTILLSASIGKSFGLRERYVQCLVKVFEFGKTRLAENKKHVSEVAELDSDSSEEELSQGNNSDDEEQGRDGDSNEVIERDIVLRPHLDKECMSLKGTEDFKLWDPLHFVRIGVEAIVDDEVTKRFSAEELKSWNLLTRTNSRYQFISVRLTIFWAMGFLMRYFILLPLRLAILVVGTVSLVLCTYFVGCLPPSQFKKSCNYHITKFCFDVLSGALSLVCTYHNRQNLPTNGICVANHTSPMDALVLACDNTYDLVGQKHGGFLGLLQRALLRASSHIFFERSESKDRYAVTKRLREHVEDPNKLPILIFPEGTCINNTSVMQFKKGTFEVGGTIYPVAIKYDPRFGDAFWNSSENGMLSYIMMMMTSWAIVCDVWYLPPVTKDEGESSIEFANRVKAEIARQGGLVDLIWDGGLKRSAAKKEWKEQHQQEFSKRLRLYSTGKKVLKTSLNGSAVNGGPSLSNNNKT